MGSINVPDHIVRRYTELAKRACITETRAKQILRLMLESYCEGYVAGTAVPESTGVTLTICGECGGRGKIEGGKDCPACGGGGKWPR